MDSAKVEECVSDALADRERQGVLSLGDVQRLIDLHGLDGDETAAVFTALRRRGLQLDDDAAEAETFMSEPSEPNKAARDTLGLMLHAAGRAKLLSAEEEVLLGRRIRIGQNLLERHHSEIVAPEVAQQIEDGKRAHDQLVLANLRLVVSIAKRYRPTTGMELADLIQEGTIGLMRAADKFDHTLGYKFSTYATWWIRQAIQRGLADKGRLIRLPVYVTEKVQKIRSTQNRLRGVLGREPTLAELARELDADPGDIHALVDIARDPISIDAPVGDDADTDLGALLDLYAGDVAEEVIRSVIGTEVRDALDHLAEHRAKAARGGTARAVEMLKLRYGFDDDHERTLEEIGTAYGITRERARQILNKILGSPELKMLLIQLTDSD